jgi:hypothetical protein
MHVILCLGKSSSLQETLKIVRYLTKMTEFNSVPISDLIMDWGSLAHSTRWILETELVRGMSVGENGPNQAISGLDSILDAINISSAQG